MSSHKINLLDRRFPTVLQRLFWADKNTPSLGFNKLLSLKYKSDIEKLCSSKYQSLHALSLLPSDSSFGHT